MVVRVVINDFVPFFILVGPHSREQEGRMNERNSFSMSMLRAKIVTLTMVKHSICELGLLKMWCRNGN